MGVVYRAHDTLLERVVALKVIATTIHDNPELRERFFREARAAGQLSHRNIITIHDLGEHEGQPYLAMECLAGEDLQHRLARADPMSFARKLEVAAEISDGLAYAHRHGVIHRDVKPANIFITDEGVVKLLDFGLARMVASEVTASNMMLGTLNYMAPEQVRGERSDHRADIFAFGVVLYEVLCGRKAFQGDSYATTLYKILQEAPEPLLSIDPALPPEAVRIVEKSLAKPLDERYQDMTEVGRDLAILRQMSRPDTPAAHPVTGRYPTPLPPGASGPTGASVPAVPVPTPPPAPPSLSPARPWSGRSASLLGAFAVLAVAGVAAGWFARSGTPAPNQAATQAAAPPAAEAVVPPQAAEPTASAPVAAPAPASTPAPPPAASDPAAPDRALAEDARSEMSRAKSAARGAGTRARQSPAYLAALAAEQEGLRLLRGGRATEAVAKFYQAAGLFSSAELTAAAPPGPAVERPDPPAQAAPPAARGSDAAPEPPAASPPATPARPEPVESPAPSPPPQPKREAPAPAPPVAAEPATAAEDGIRDLLTEYEHALEGRSVAAMKRIWPSLDGGQEAALRNEFANARSIDVTIESPRIVLSGAAGTVTFIRRYQLLTVDSQRLMTTSRTTMTVRRAENAWVIERLRFEAPQ